MNNDNNKTITPKLTKTGRKNKTGLVVKWPSSWFTIKTLHENNKQFGAQITLRSRVEEAKKTEQLKCLGYMQSAKGRPQLVYAMTPVSEKTIADAKTNGMLDTSDIISVATIDVNSTPSPQNPQKVSSGNNVTSASNPTSTNKINA